MAFVRFPLLLTILIHVFAICAEGQAFTGPETVIVHSGALQLRALLWKPHGDGMFPAVLFNHGRGTTPQTEGRIEGISDLGQTFAGNGYIFMALFRHGEGLSADQGAFIGDLLASERAAKGDRAANLLQLRLLESDQLQDVLAGLKFLRTLPQVDSHRTAVIGHSFGGSLALLVAERDPSVKAVVNFAGAAGSWEGIPEMQARLLTAVRRITAPVFFVYAVNDLSITPGKVLSGEMRRLGKVHRVTFFPPFGKTAAEAHQFVFLGRSRWERDVLEFLEEHLRFTCSQPVTEQEALIREAENGNYTTRRVEFLGNRYTRDDLLRRRVSIGLQEGDLFSRWNLVRSLRNVSRLKIIYPVTVRDVELRLDRPEKIIDLTICFREKKSLRQRTRG